MAIPAMTRHVKELWPEANLSDLIETAESVDRMVATPGWQAVQRVIEAEVAMIDRELDLGRRVLEQGEYAKAHGRRGALRIADEAARAIIDEAIRRQQRAEDEEREAA